MVIPTLNSLSVSTFQLSTVQAAAVAELLRIAPVADRLGELFNSAGHELYSVSYTHLTLPTTERV